MKEIKLEKCIRELNKPNKKRDESIILDYLRTLEKFMNLMQEKNENSEEIIKKISKIMSYQKNIPNDLIIQYGEKGNEFYIILKGTIGILVPKYDEYYMDEEEFILYLLKLRKYNQNELIIQCLRQNALNFSIHNERFDDLLYNLQNKKPKDRLLIFTKKVIKKAREVYDYINSEEFTFNKNNIINISPEEYISSLEVDENIKINTNKLNYLKKLNIDFDSKDEDKKLVKIPNYEMVSKFGEGETFGELALEHLNKKRMATIIALSECDFAVIDKLEYNELIKDSMNKSKNKFYNLIYKYKIFDSISGHTFDKKYYNHFKHIKMKKNSILFNEGDLCDKVYFILNGEFELFVEKNIQEVNQIILQLKEIVDYLKSIIKSETKKIINESIKNKNKLYIKIKNNLEQFFSKFENEINLEEVAFEIKNSNLVNKKKHLGNNFNKIFFEKKNIKLGICKSIQIIGLADIINRFTGNDKYFFNCKCFSYSGELYYIDYKNFLNIYEHEENVKLYTSQFLFQNLYYIIGRLISHKKFIFEKAVNKENEFINLLHLELNNQSNDSNRDNNKRKKNLKNVITNKIKNTSRINFENNINDINIKINDFDSFQNKQNSNINYRIEPLTLRKNINLNIMNHINILKITNNTNYSSLSENNNNEKYNINSSSSRNNISNLEKDIFSKNKTNVNNKINIQASLKITKKKNKFISRNILKENNYSLKIKNKFDSHDSENKFEFPIIVINDKEVKINENNKRNCNTYKNNYKNLFKYIDSKNKKLVDLINSKEVKNIAIYSDPNDSIEIKNKYKNLFRKKKEFLLLTRNNISKINPNNKEINKYSDKNNLYYTTYDNKNRFLKYSLSDLSGKYQKEIILKINESKSIVYKTKKRDKKKYDKEDNKKLDNNINKIKSSNYEIDHFKVKYKYKNSSHSPLQNLILKKNLSSTFYIYKNSHKDFHKI